MRVDWGTGCYERTAAELEPVSRAVVLESGAPGAGTDVLDVACGTGNAALLAAEAGARAVGIDSSPRLLDVARGRAAALGLTVDFRQGDMLELPVGDEEFDLVVSIFGVIFAADPARALEEVARVLRPAGRALVTAWIPSGPIDAMVGTMARAVQRVTQAPPPPRRLSWSDPAAVARLSSAAGLELVATTPRRLAIRAESPEAYLAAGREHPMSLAARPVLRAHDAEADAEAEMLAVLREGNEDPDGFLVHSPYVIHELRPRLAR